MRLQRFCSTSRNSKSFDPSYRWSASISWEFLLHPAKVSSLTNPQVYFPELVELLLNLSDLYLVELDYFNAEKSLQEALDICTDLSNITPEIYLSHLIQTYSKLQIIYLKTENEIGISTNSEKQEELSHMLYKKNPFGLFKALREIIRDTSNKLNR